MPDSLKQLIVNLNAISGAIDTGDRAAVVRQLNRAADCLTGIADSDEFFQRLYGSRTADSSQINQEIAILTADLRTLGLTDKDLADRILYLVDPKVEDTSIQDIRGALRDFADRLDELAVSVRRDDRSSWESALRTVWAVLRRVAIGVSVLMLLSKNVLETNGPEANLAAAAVALVLASIDELLNPKESAMRRKRSQKITNGSAVSLLNAATDIDIARLEASGKEASRLRQQRRRNSRPIGDEVSAQPLREDEQGDLDAKPLSPIIDSTGLSAKYRPLLRPAHQDQKIGDFLTPEQRRESLIENRDSPRLKGENRNQENNDTGAG